MFDSTNEIHIASARRTIQVILPSGDILEGPTHRTIEEYLRVAIDKRLLENSYPLIACICNGRLRELTYELIEDAHIKPIFLSDSDGGRIYRRSLVLLLTTAVEELFPSIRVTVSYAVPDGGFYCELANREAFSIEEIQQIEAHMRQIVQENTPISKRIVNLQDAIKLFESRGELDKVRLMQFRKRDNLTLYRLRNREDYHYGYIVPSSGYLQTFKLIPLPNGFIMQYPRSANPLKLYSVATNLKLIDVFHESDDWLQRMNVEDMGRMNTFVEQESLQELILVAEALHEQRVAAIATEIDEHHTRNGVRIVLIAGPSSSGKTTFAKRLAIQLLAHGLRPFTLEMDNYFVDRHLTPLDEDGNYDFEALNALNLLLFNEHLLQLLEGKRVQFPKFDFRTGTSLVGSNSAQLADNQIIILEGIHGLNPDLIPQIDPKLAFRIYVSALTALNIDSHNRIPTTDMRLLRRIVRDARTRGYNASQTLNRWASVRRGEKRNIFLYQENADSIFNSALVYELAALRPLADPLLLQVPYGTPEHIEANRLLSFLAWVSPMTLEQRVLIPDTSLLREFMGGSILEDYHPGSTQAEQT